MPKIRGRPAAFVAPAGKKRKVDAAAEKPIVRRPPTPRDDPFDATVAEILKVIDHDINLNKEVRAILRISVPVSLRPVPNARHRYQDEVVQELRKSILAVQAKRQSLVDAATARADDFASQRDAADKATFAAVSRESELQGLADAADAAHREATSRVVEAGGALKSAKEAVKRLKEQQGQEVNEKGACNTLINEAWSELKAGTVPGNHRSRKKKIEGLLQVLEREGVEKSLRLAMPITLNKKPEDRQHYGLQAIHFCEEYLQAWLRQLTEKVDGHLAAVEEAEKKVAAAESLLFTEQAEHAKRAEELAKASSDLTESKKAKKAGAEKAKKNEIRAKGALDKLPEVQARLASVTDSLALLDALIERGEAAARPEKEATEVDEAEVADGEHMDPERDEETPGLECAADEAAGDVVEAERNPADVDRDEEMRAGDGAADVVAGADAEAPADATDIVLPILA